MNDAKSSRQGRQGVYQGWYVVATVTTMLAVTSGSRFLFGVVLKPLSDEYGWSREALASAVTINVIILTILQPLIGIAVDRWGSRRILLIGTLGTALLSVPITLANQLWQIYLFYSVIAAASFAAMSPVNITKLVSGWFTKKRAMALSIASSGAAFGQLAVIPIATWIMAHFGWRVSYWTIAVAVVGVMLPIGWFFVRDAPAGASDDANDDGEAARAARIVQEKAEPKLSIWQAIRVPAYWQLSFGFFVCGYTMSFTQVHMIPYFLDMPEHSALTMQTVASVAIAAVGGASVLGAILIGFLADRVGHRQMLTMTYFLRGLSFMILLLAGSNIAGIFLAAVVMGVSWTSTTPLTSAISADIYGRASLGTIFGFIFSAMNLGVGVGSIVAGRDYDLTGNYHFALIANAFLGFAAAAIIQVVRVRPLFPIGGRATVAQPTLSGAGDD
jgi:MFS family permease